MTTPDGWVLVPIEPDEAMLNSAVDVDAFKLGDISPLGFRISPQMLFARCYAAMLSSAPPPPAVEGWRDIATAPRDGTPILVANACNGAVYDARWEERGGNGPGWVDGVIDLCEDEIVYSPSHWQPLPPPPAESEAT